MEAQILMGLSGLALALGGIIAGRGFAMGRISTLVDGLRSDFTQHRKEIREDIGRIDARCENRFAVCGGHFTEIDKKVAALSGKANDR